MPLKISSISSDRVKFEFENTISIWNILKFLVSTPYLKHFVVENYEGGNTLVPKEIWEQEGIMFKKISPSAFFFPYESIGFVIDDSIDTINLYVIEHYEDNFDYKTNAEMVFSIKDTDSASVIIDKQKSATFISLYFLSLMKIGFDRQLLSAFDLVFKNFSGKDKYVLTYVPSSLAFNIKNANFIIALDEEKDSPAYYKITYSNKKCKKEIIKEENIKSPLHLKKKILEKNKYFPIIYYSVLVIASVVVIRFNFKIFLMLLVIYFVLTLIYRYFKKHAFKLFFNPKNNTIDHPKE